MLLWWESYVFPDSSAQAWLLRGQLWEDLSLRKALHSLHT